MIKGSLDAHAGKVYLLKISTSLQRATVVYWTIVKHDIRDRQAEKVPSLHFSSNEYFHIQEVLDHDLRRNYEQELAYAPLFALQDHTKGTWVQAIRCSSEANSDGECRFLAPSGCA
jgi:hypothetical protein